MNQLDCLKQYSTVVADTGDFMQIRQYRPQDATTNPSLILKAIQKPEYHYVLNKVKGHLSKDSLDLAMDRLIVYFGIEILKIIPGRVSTEVDARLSYDTQASIDRAKRIVSLYKAEGIDPSRLLIKIASTWEGIQAAKVLQEDGIHCNLTLLFSLEQSVACAQAKVQLISPFVGRIYDWHKKNLGPDWNEAAHAGANDPGVQSVKNIYNYYKKFDIQTQIMGASFRNIGQIQALAGCDLLTISPDLLKELQSHPSTFEAALLKETASLSDAQMISLDQETFHTQLKTNAMASQKLEEGISSFCADAIKIEDLLKSHNA